MSLQLCPPESLTPSYRMDVFSCGELVLDDWLKRRTMLNHVSGASSTFVMIFFSIHAFFY